MAAAVTDLTLVPLKCSHCLLVVPAEVRIFNNNECITLKQTSFTIALKLYTHFCKKSLILQEGYQQHETK